MRKFLTITFSMFAAVCWAMTGSLGHASYITTLDTIAGGNKISYWNLNEATGTTAADSWAGIDGANTGTYSGTGITVGAAGPRPTDGFQGLSGANNATAFAGTSTTQLLSMNPDDFVGLENLTLLMFVKLDPSATGNDRFLGGIHATTGSNRYAFSLISRTTAIRGGVRVWDGSAELGGLADAAGGAFRDNVWHFVALTMENNGADKLVKMYIDGVERAQALSPIAGAGGDGLAPRVTTDATGALSFGNDLGDSARWLRGSLDEIAFINGALSASQIGELWTAAVVPEPSSFALLTVFGLSGLVRLQRRRAMAR